jgi:hypothetical protein
VDIPQCLYNPFDGFSLNPPPWTTSSFRSAIHSDPSPPRANLQGDVHQTNMKGYSSSSSILPACLLLSHLVSVALVRGSSSVEVRTHVKLSLPDRPFIGFTGAKKTDPETRRLIRSHVMLGKNCKSNRHGKAGVTESDDQPASAYPVIPAIPRRIGSDLTFTTFPDKIDALAAVEALKRMFMHHLGYSCALM